MLADYSFAQKGSEGKGRGGKGRAWIWITIERES